METSIVNLENEHEKVVLKIDESFWSLIQFIAFYEQLIEIRMKTGKSHSFLHFWAYEIINNNNHSEEELKIIYKLEGCQFRFSISSTEFIDSLYKEADYRGLLLFDWNG